jgi:hypothetical protein
MEKVSTVQGLLGISGKEFIVLENKGNYYVTLEDAGTDLYTALKEDLEFSVFEEHRNQPYVCLEKAIDWYTRDDGQRKSLDIKTLLKLHERIKAKNFTRK